MNDLLDTTIYVIIPLLLAIASISFACWIGKRKYDRQEKDSKEAKKNE